MRKQIVKRTMAFLICAILLIGLAACGASEKKEESKEGNTEESKEESTEESKDEPEEGTGVATKDGEFGILDGKTISFMTSQGKYFEQYQTMADAIKEDYGCDVEFQVVPDGEYDALLQVKLSTSEVPDTFEHNMPSRNIALGVAQNCEDLSNEPWMERVINPDLIKDKADGKVYGLPKESSSGYQIVFYNKEVLESCGITDPDPKTYDEFIEILKTVKEKGNGVTPLYATNADTWTTQIFMTGGIAAALGDRVGKVTDQLLANEIEWTGIPECTDILTRYTELEKAGYWNEDHMSVGYDTAVEAVCTGKAAMYYTIEQWAADAQGKYPDVELGSFVISFGDKQLLPTGNYVQGLYVPKEGAQVDAAKAFLQVWSMPKYQKLYYDVNPGFPAFDDVDGGDVVPAVASIVDQYIKTGNYVFEMNSLLSDAGAIWPDLWNNYIEAIQGTKTPKEVFEGLQRDYVDIMQQQGFEGF
ncbi:extracellular solute-binding protein [Lachnospiraceae bacterium ZAX-1]